MASVLHFHRKPNVWCTIWISVLYVRQVQMHSLLDSDLLSDCLARQHLHVSHQDPSPPLPVLDDFTGTSTEAHTPLLKTKTNKGQTPGPLNFGACGLICSPSPCFIPALIAHHAAVYFVQLLGSDCGWAGSVCCRSASINPLWFSSFAVNGWTGLKKLSGTNKLFWQRTEPHCPRARERELSGTITSHSVFTQKALRTQAQTVYS